MGGESGGASTTTKLVVTAAAVGAGALAYYCYTNKLHSSNAQTKSHDAMEAAAAAAVVRDTEASQTAAAAAATPTGTSLVGNESGPQPPRTLEELKLLTMEELQSLTVEELKSLDAQISLHASSHDAAVAAVEQRVTDVVLRTSTTAPARAALAAADAAKAGWCRMTVSKTRVESVPALSA